MAVEVTVKMSMRVNAHPRKWLERSLSDWVDSLLELDEELVNFQIEIKEEGIDFSV